MKHITTDLSQEDSDATRISEFLERLAPLSKKYAKSSAEEMFFGMSKGSVLERKYALLDHLFSLSDDGAFLARVRVEHESAKMALALSKQAYRNKK